MTKDGKILEPNELGIFAFAVGQLIVTITAPTVREFLIEHGMTEQEFQDLKTSVNRAALTLCSEQV